MKITTMIRYKKKRNRGIFHINFFFLKFIVQSLVGNASWSSVTRTGKFYHVGTIPNKKSNTYVSDLRMMVTGNKNYSQCVDKSRLMLLSSIGSEQGFRPICIYGRKARLPLTGDLKPDGKQEILNCQLRVQY